MLFNSLHFAIFLPLVAGVYFALPYRVRWIFLLFASYYFYMAWNPAYIILIVLTTMIDYTVSMMMSRSETQFQRRKWLSPAPITAAVAFRTVTCSSYALRRCFRIFPVDDVGRASRITISLGRL